jgi:MobA/MobL family
MALFYVRVKTFARTRGQSSVNAAAYRAADSFRDERTGVTHNYSRKTGVLEVFLTAPPDAPAWCSNPKDLWNAAEEAERKNGTPAREVLVALPAELTTEQSFDLARSIAQHLVAQYRIAAMTCVHAPDRKGDQRNIHAHIMITTREVGPDGLGKKTRVLDDRQTGPKEVAAIRAAVARLTNDHLARAGHAVRVDHSSLKRQSIAAEERGDFVSAIRLIRSSTEHEGPAATAARRRGERSEVAESNDRIRGDNIALQRQFISRARSIVIVPRSHIGGVAWATGHDADLLNAQARSTRETAQMEADMSHAYRTMLADVIRDLGQRAAPVLEYAQLRQLTPTQTRELADHARNPRLGLIVRSLLRTEHSRRHAEGLHARRGRRYATAMVRTADAARALRESEERGPRTKREWAKLRRDQAAALEAARHHETRAEKLTRHEAAYRAGARVRAAQERVDELEAERRRRFPISQDRSPSVLPPQNQDGPILKTLEWRPSARREQKGPTPRRP